MKILFKVLFKVLFTALILLIFACNPSKKLNDEDALIKQDDGIIEFQFFHINDVYEIAALENGKAGGMARVTTIFKELKAKNPNTFFIHAGDFLNPFLLGTLKYKGKRIRRKQMVEAMDASGVDLVTFGNHEFDIKEKDLQERLNESNFTWLATSVKHKMGDQVEPFYKMKNGQKEYVSDDYIFEISDADSTTLKIGFFGPTIPSNPQDGVAYDDIYKTSTDACSRLSKQTDLILGLTHLGIGQDKKLAKLTPFVPLIMGGHDHHHSMDTIGNVVIAKAGANAKTALLHKFTFDKNTKKVSFVSELITINDKIESAPEVQAIVDKWTKIQDVEILKVIPEPPYEVIYKAVMPLDAREKTIRNHQTNFGQRITAAMTAAAKKPVDCAILNSGTVRIDDKLFEDVFAIDMFRAMPFGGDIKEVEMKGSLLKKTLDIGLINKGSGGYLQWNKIEYVRRIKVGKSAVNHWI
jgi:5'-nucleotidase/UDP-sugar diphosphatase